MESSETRPDNCHGDSQEPSPAVTSPVCEPSLCPGLSVSGLVIHKMKERILSRSGRHLVSLDILVHPSFVEANGIVASYYGKQLVTHALLDLLPGMDIRNSLSVRPLPGRDLED